MINILLVVQPVHTGLSYHRQLIPHLHLERTYSDYNIKVTSDVNEFSDADLKHFQIVYFLRLVNEQGKTNEIIKRCKDAGCKVIIDIDDYWLLHKSHELNQSYIENEIAKQTIEGLASADYITTTTEHFATEISKINKNVCVLANSIDTEQEQFKPMPTTSNRLRLGWIGGVYHAPDIRLIYEGLKDVYKTTDNNKFQFCLGGFNPNDAYKFFEYVFTNEYKAIKDKDYLKYLHEFKEQGFTQGFTQPYQRLWAKNVYQYATLYNDIDVALVPLVGNQFNSFKSQIKIIEAGFFKKPVIVSNVMPYTIDCNKNNSVLITPSKHNEGWNTAIKSFIYNPNKVQDYAEALHETVKVKYHMDTVNEVRNQLYKRICE